MLTDIEIRQTISDGALGIEPILDACVQPASYDFRVGRSAFASSSNEKIDVAHRGLVIIEPGEFAVIETLEKVSCSSRIAAQLGLRSEYARRGLLMLSGPQIDPGFSGILVVRLVNLAPTKVTLPYEAPFLTVQFFMLSSDVERPYEGTRQGQTGISSTDIQELSQTEGLTMGQVVKTLGTLATDVAELKGSVGRLAVWVPVLIALGMTIIGIIVAIK